MLVRSLAFAILLSLGFRFPAHAEDNENQSRCEVASHPVDVIAQQAQTQFSFRTHIKPDEFLRARESLETLDAVWANATEAPSFLDYLRTRSDGFKMLQALVGEETALSLRNRPSLAADRNFLGQAILYRLFFPDLVSSGPAIESFRSALAEISGVAERLTALKLYYETQRPDPSLVDLEFNRLLGYYVREGVLDMHRAPPFSFKEWMKEWTAEAEVMAPDYGKAATENAQRLIRSIQAPETWTWSPPEILTPLNRTWDWVIAQRKKYRRRALGQQVFSSVETLLNYRGPDKINVIYYTVRALESYWVRYIEDPRVSPEVRRNFLEILSHNFYKLVSALSEKSARLEIEGDWVSFETYQLLQSWCRRLHLPIVSYNPGVASGGKLDPSSTDR